MAAKICPKCGKEFVPGFAGINLVVVTMRKCPHCGKLVNINKALSPKKEKESSPTMPSEEEILKRRIEESKRE